MTLKQCADELNLTLLNDIDYEDSEINGAYCGDLLSDVMGRAENGSVLITVQAHINVIAVAVLKEFKAVIITSDFTPEKETLLKARNENIPVFKSNDNSFKTAGKMYSLINES